MLIQKARALTAALLWPSAAGQGAMVATLSNPGYKGYSADVQCCCGQAQLAEARQQADAVEAARAAAADAAARLGAGPRRDVAAQAPQDGGAASPEHSPRPASRGAPPSPRRDIGALLEEMEALRARLQARPFRVWVGFEVKGDSTSPRSWK